MSQRSMASSTSAAPLQDACTRTASSGAAASALMSAQPYHGCTSLAAIPHSSMGSFQRLRRGSLSTCMSVLMCAARARGSFFYRYETTPFSRPFSRRVFLDSAWLTAWLL